MPANWKNNWLVKKIATAVWGPLKASKKHNMEIEKTTNALNSQNKFSWTTPKTFKIRTISFWLKAKKRAVIFRIIGQINYTADALITSQALDPMTDVLQSAPSYSQEIWNLINGLKDFHSELSEGGGKGNSR